MTMQPVCGEKEAVVRYWYRPFPPTLSRKGRGSFW